MITPAPGDLLATRSPGGASWAIRLQAAVRDEPNLVNHIAVVHHTDAHGVMWAIEGRPGGVGWRDARDYLGSSWTVGNVAQPKTAAQRQVVTDGAVKLLGTPYDWAAIEADAGEMFGLGELWRPSWHGQVPGHVVCSSLAAYLYRKAGLGWPGVGDGREVTPAQWLELWIMRGWDA